MGIFGKKKDKVVDWSEGYRMPAKRVSASRSSNSSSDLGFLGNLASSGTSSSSDVTWDSDSPSVSSPSASSFNHSDPSDKRQKLTRRLLDMTNRIEDLSNQVYHLKQRIEVLEKKLKINFD